MTTDWQSALQVRVMVRVGIRARVRLRLGSDNRLAVYSSGDPGVCECVRACVRVCVYVCV